MDKVQIDKKLLERELRKERMIRVWNNILIFSEYLIREPYYEIKSMLSILRNNEVSLMWASFILLIYLYNNHMLSRFLFYSLFLVMLTSWVFGVYKSGEWMKYYKEKYNIDRKV